MPLDLRILYFVLFAMSVVLGAAELLFFLRRPQNRGVGWWAAGNLLGAAGMLLVGLHGLVPALASIAFANTLAVAALVAAWFGVLAYDQRRLPLWPAALLLLLQFAAFAIPSRLSASLAARIVVVAVVMGGLELANTWTSRRIARRDGSVAAAICATMMLACALTSFSRGIYVGLVGAEPDYMGHDAFHAWTIFLLVPAVAGWNMGLMMMSSERTQRALARAARTDGMTGTLNRDGFREQAQRQLARLARTRRHAALALIDLDHFKTINDRGGHAAGDRVLCAFAQVAAKELREGDLLGRHGGDEFAVLFEEIDADQAERITARLRQRFAEATHEIIAGIHPTLSVGVALFRPGMSLDALLSLADVALYRAKAGGRDSVALVRDPPDAQAGETPAGRGTPMRTSSQPLF
ncbi:MAG: GGDEF domain-containing protein [Solimonas sp.]